MAKKVISKRHLLARTEKLRAHEAEDVGRAIFVHIVLNLLQKTFQNQKKKQQIKKTIIPEIGTRKKTCVQREREKRKRENKVSKTTFQGQVFDPRGVTEVVVRVRIEEVHAAFQILWYQCS